MVGHIPLEDIILVRIQVSQPWKEDRLTCPAKRGEVGHINSVRVQISL